MSERKHDQIIFMLHQLILKMNKMSEKIKLNDDCISTSMKQLAMLEIHMSELKSQLNLIEDAIVNDDRND